MTAFALIISFAEGGLSTGYWGGDIGLYPLRFNTYIQRMAEWQVGDRLLDRLRRARSVAVLTGAGVSAESGIPTFRSSGGFWGEYKAEDLATPEGFARNPKFVWDWYIWRRGLVNQAEPNPGHRALARMENFFEAFTLITQNVDGLHQRAGSKSVIELHGNIMRSRCNDCGEPARVPPLDEASQLAACDCGGLIRPDVVWFGELLPLKALKQAERAARLADVFMSVGTSSLVHPAAGLAEFARRNGAFLIEINPAETEMSDIFDETLRGPSGEILLAVIQQLGITLMDTSPCLGVE